MGGPSLRQERGARLRTDPPTTAGFESTVACVATCVEAGGFKKIVVPALITLVLSVALSVPAPIHLCAPDQRDVIRCGTVPRYSARKPRAVTYLEQLEILVEERHMRRVVKQARERAARARIHSEPGTQVDAGLRRGARRRCSLVALRRAREL